jgi:hypothetical protein
MKDITEKNFGVIIAFWLPGFLFLWGLSYSWPLVATWLAKSNDTNAPTIGGFLYATLASLAVGLLINAVRWALVQEVLFHGITRLHRAAINYENLKTKTFCRHSRRLLKTITAIISIIQTRSSR